MLHVPFQIVHCTKLRQLFLVHSSPMKVHCMKQPFLRGHRGNGEGDSPFLCHMIGDRTETCWREGHQGAEQGIGLRGDRQPLRELKPLSPRNMPPPKQNKQKLKLTRARVVRFEYFKEKDKNWRTWDIQIKCR